MIRRIVIMKSIIGLLATVLLLVGVSSAVNAGSLYDSYGPESPKVIQSDDQVYSAWDETLHAWKFVNAGCAAGESFCLVDSPNSYVMINPGVSRSIALMTDIAVDGAGSTTTLSSGQKTFFSKIVGSSGAQSATITIWGDYKSTATEEFLICTMALSGTVEDAKKCTVTTDDYDYYHAKIASISGTGAVVNVWAKLGIGSGGSSGGGGGGTVDNAGTFAVQESGAALTALQLIDNIVSGSGANISQINGVTPLMGAGNTGTGSPRVTISTDQAALGGMGIGVEDAAHVGGENLVRLGCRRNDVAAVSSGTDGDWSTVDCTPLGAIRVAHVDPCSSLAKIYVPFSISTATTTQLVAASASNSLYGCNLTVLPTAGAQNVALVEDDTSACASPTAGMAGGTTAATGANNAANGGFVLGSGLATVVKTAATNRYVCLITSAAVQTSGVFSYVLAP